MQAVSVLVDANLKEINISNKTCFCFLLGE